MTPWLIRPRANPRAALRLLCFPFAGGDASVFRTWPAQLPPDVEVLAVELPGRETRLREPLIERRSALVTALADAILPELQGPVAIFGHSLGALIGFDLARELRRRSLPAPVHLLVSGRRAPQCPDPSPMRSLPEAEFLARLRRLGGTSDVVLRDPDLVAYFLPMLRADFSLNETEPYRDEPPLACPITALGGANDERTSLPDLDAWHAQTSATFEREIFPGGHFFIQTARERFLGALSRRLARITAAL